MNKLKKILSSVLALGLIASTIVLPVSVKAADGDIIYKYTFDNGTDEGLLGTNGTYTTIPGNVSFNNVQNLGLDERDKLLVIGKYGGAAYRGTSETATSTPGDLLFGTEHGDDFVGKKHVTIQFDMILSNAYDQFDMLPSDDDRFGMRITNASGQTSKIVPLRVENSNWTYAETEGAYDREVWREYALEYDMNNGIFKIYVDGTEVYQTEGLTVGNDAPSDFQMFASCKNSSYAINNFYVYEGGYDADAVADPDYTIMESYDFSTEAQFSAFTPNPDNEKQGASTPAAGFAGKAASDQVAYLVTGGDGHNVKYGLTYPNASVITGEMSVIPGSDSVFIYNATKDGARYGLRLENGVLKIVLPDDGWKTETIAGYENVDKTVWHKLAMEINADDDKFYFYFDGVKVAEKSATIDGTNRTQDIRIGGKAYIDDVRVYVKPYTVDEAITAASTSKVTVNGTTLSAMEGVTFNDFKAAVAGADAARFYSDETLTTETADIAAAKYMVVEQGDLYKKFDLVIQSPYGDKLLWLDFTDAADATTIGAAHVDGFAGKAALDKVAYASADTGRKYLNGGNTLAITSGVVTYEASIYVPAGSTSIMHLFNGGGWNTRLGMKINADGSITIGQMVTDSSVWTGLNDTATTYGVAENTWNKLAMEMNANTDTVKFYLNDALVKTVAFTADLTAIGIQFAFETKNTYIDNMRIYTAPYVAGTPIAAVAGAVDGVISVQEGTTPEQVKAKVTDGSTAQVYTSDLTTVSNTLKDGDVLIINKGELYKSYAIDVAGLYDGSYLLVDFDDQRITNEGTGFGKLSDWLYANDRQETNDEGETVKVSRKDEVTTSYVTGLGGKTSDDYVYKVVSPATETQRNVRFQTGYGSPSTHVTEAGVYTYEADVYRGTTANSGASIMIKMRNTTDTNNMQITLPSPFVANRWYKLAITVDTVNKTVKGYVNGVDATSSLTYYGTDYDAETHVAGSLVFNSKDYTVVSDQVNVNFSESKTAEVVTATDNMRLYAGAYKSGKAPSVIASVTMDENSTVADVLDETGADFVVDTNGNVVSSNAAAVATGYQAVTVEGEFFAYTTVEVFVPVVNEDVVFSNLKVGETYTGKDGVDYVFVAVTTGTIADMSLYDTFRVTDGVEVKEMALSDIMGTTLTGEAEIGILVMNVPDANKANFKAKLVLAD